MRKYFAILLAVLTIISCLSACKQHTAFERSNTRFIERSYWFDDPNASLDLTFYYTGKSFADDKDEISRCSIGIDENEIFACELIGFGLKDKPLYETGGDEYYQGNLSIKFNDLASSIRGAQLILELSDGTVGTYPIGDIFYSTINEAANREAQQFIEYALINPAIYTSREGSPKTAAVALEIQVHRSLMIERLTCEFKEIGLDAQNTIVYAYDDYISNVSEPLDNMELDKIIDGIYDRKVVASQNTDCKIELDSGKYVLLIPITQSSDDVLEPMFTGLDIEFRVDGKRYSTHVYCNPLFTENSHSLAEVTALFES